MCRRLRILQCLRSIGTLLSFDQLAAMEETRLTQRLAQQQHFQMAFEFADILSLSVTPILTIWAKHLLSAIPKVGEHTAQERQTHLSIVTDMILSKFELHQSRAGADQLPYVSVANHAYSIGRAAHDELFLNAAWNIVKASPSARGRFEALLLWEDYERAVRVAVESGDANMIFMVISQATEDQSEADLDHRIIPMLNSFPESAAMLRTYVRMLSNAPGGVDASSSAGQLVRQYTALFRETETMRMLGAYFSAVDALRREASKPAGGGASSSLSLQIDRKNIVVRDAAHEAENANRNERGGAANTKVMHLQVSLIDKQRDLAMTTGDRSFYSASVIQTIQLCHKHKRTSDANELVEAFSVSEKMVTWAKLRAFISAKQWGEVDKLAAVRKGPISPDALVAALMEAGELMEAAKHIPKLNPIERRMELYVACGDWRGACEDCLRNREEEMLPQLRKTAKTESAIAIIDAAIRKAGK